MAASEAAAFNAVPDAQLLPDPPATWMHHIELVRHISASFQESDGYKGKKPGPEVLFLEDLWNLRWCEQFGFAS